MIGEVLESLEAAPGQGPGVMSRRVLRDAHVDLFAAVRKPKNTPMLLIETSAHSLPRDFAVPDASGFSVLLEPIEPGPHGRIRIELELVEPSGETVFVALIEDVLGRVAAADSERQAVAMLAAAIHRWQRFFRARGSHGLSQQQQQGLLGELLFLRKELARAVSMELALGAWTGPSGSNQDFEFGGHGFEVKTTASNPLTQVRISNLRQLDDEVLKSLHLVVVEVERHQNADGTLPQAVEETRAAVSAQAPHLVFDLADQLVEYGYLDQDAAAYANTGYGVRGVRVFAVSRGFPRLVEADVPDGVGDVKYSIALASLREFEVPSDDLRKAMAEWVRGLG